MTPTLSEPCRTLLEAPLRVPRAADALGRALFLYVAILLAAEHGLSIRSRMRLAQELGVSEETIDAWVERLVKAKLILVLSPSPYLAIKLTFWSGCSFLETQKPQQSSGKQRLTQRNARGSSKLLLQQAAALSSNGDRGPGEGVPSEVEIREVLGDPTVDVKVLVQGVPAAAVRQALVRVRETPSIRIRTSKTALFRYLLAKFSQELDVDEL